MRTGHPNSDPAAMKRVRLRHVAGLWATCRPWEWTHGQLKSFVAVVETLASGHLLLCELGAWIREIVVAQSFVYITLCEKVLRETLHLLTVGILTQLLHRDGLGLRVAGDLHVGNKGQLAPTSVVCRKIM